MAVKTTISHSFVGLPEDNQGFKLFGHYTIKKVVSGMLVDTKNLIISSIHKKYGGIDYLTVGTAYYLSVDRAMAKQLMTTGAGIAGHEFHCNLSILIFTYAFHRPFLPHTANAD